MAFNYQSPPPFTPPPDAGVGAPVPPAPVSPGPPGPAGPLVPMGGMPGPGMNGIPGATGSPLAPYPVPPGPPDPSQFKYSAETQQDGTILLRMMNPDGTPGPVLQVIHPKGLSKHGGK